MTSESPSVIKGVTPSVLAVPATTAPRFIPGLASSMVTPAAKKRARKTIKAKTAVVVPSEAPDSPVDIKEVESKIEASESPVVVAEEAKVELGDDVIGDEPLKITNAVEAVQKRVRAANKKIQRIATYEAESEALNADQKKAVASKSGLEASVKELTELIQILKDEEAVENIRSTKISSIQEKKAVNRVKAAIAAYKLESESDLVYLLQFLHLNTLYGQQNTRFAPLPLPEVVAQATGQEVAAVRMLHHIFSTGSSELESIDRLSKIKNASGDEVIQGVTFARINELVAGLKSAPAAVPAAVEPSSAAELDDSTKSIADAQVDAAMPSFLQESELMAAPEPIPVASWADSVEESISSTAPLATIPSSAAAPSAAPSSATTIIPPPPIVSWKEETSASAIDWAAEDSGELPSLAGLIDPAFESGGANGFHTKPSRGSRGVGGARGGAGEGYRGRGGGGDGRSGRGEYRGRGGEGGRGRGRGSFPPPGERESRDGGEFTTSDRGAGFVEGGARGRGRGGRGRSGRGRGGAEQVNGDSQTARNNGFGDQTRTTASTW